MQRINSGLNQSLFDIALQHHGGITSTIEIAVANGIALDADLTPGTELKLKTLDELDAETQMKQVVYHYRRNGIIPATAITEDAEVVLEGVGYWFIEDDFIVQ